MFFGIACYSDAEVAVVLADELDQFVGVTQTAFDGLEVFLSLWRVASQGHDVFNAGCRGLVEPCVQFVRGGPYTCEVGHGGVVEVVLDFPTPADGSVARGAAGSVCAGQKGGAVLYECLHVPTQGFVAFRCFGWKDFNRDSERLCVVDFRQPHVGVLSFLEVV